MDFLSRFSEIQQIFSDIERQMSDPEIISDVRRYQELVQRHSELSPGIAAFHQYQNVIQQRTDVDVLLDDPDLRELAKIERDELVKQQAELELALSAFLIPPSQEDRKNAILEIRSGTGGEEAALFAAVLYRMYVRFAEINRWTVEVLNENSTGLGGIKEVSFIVSGFNVFQKLKYEIGTHRVQRVPDTESSGRIHTSAATVAVLPEAEEVDVVIEPKDLRIDVYRAQGAGGQHVNKTSSAVRITHIPTGIAVACQDERSQFQNKDKAMRLLRSRLYEGQLAVVQKEAAQLRKSQVGTGDRSEKIRTYNYPQSRVTDHRIGLTLHCLDDVLNGNKLDLLISALAQADRIEKLGQQ